MVSSYKFKDSPATNQVWEYNKIIMASVLEKIYKYQLNTEKSRLNLECKSVWEK